MQNKYTAVATLDNGSRVWDVTIYSGYESIPAALEGVTRFLSHGYNVIAIKIFQAKEAKS